MFRRPDVELDFNDDLAPDNFDSLLVYFSEANVRLSIMLFIFTFRVILGGISAKSRNLS